MIKYMGTLCKNCPFKGAKRTEGSCTELFAKKFHNSCVTYDISKHQFLEELKEFENEVKNAKEKEEEVATEIQTQEIPSEVKDIPLKEEKPKRVRKTTAKKATTKKAATKKIEKEITEEIKSETNDENTVTD
jgi:hypothetical protein